MLHIYTDGSCSGNPGAGGWAYIMVTETLQGDPIIARDSGGTPDTTNNRMEIQAVISALEALKKMTDMPRAVTLYTDSQYVQKGITEWIHSWKRNSWRTSGKRQVKNLDLWQELDALAAGLQSGGLSISWNWIRGHEGNKYNELCDKFAKNAIALL